MATPQLGSSGQYDQLIQKHYLDPLIDQTIQENILLSRIQKTSSLLYSPTGEEIIIPIKTALSSGIGHFSAVNDSNTLPTAGTSYADQYVIPFFQVQAAAQVPDIVMARMTKHSWVQPFTNEMEDVQQSMENDFNVNYYGDGSATLATVSSFTDGTPDTVTVDTTYNLQKGQIIDFIDTNDDDRANAVDVTITEILSETTFSATMTGTPEDTDRITHANSLNKVTPGLESMIGDSGDFQGITLRENKRWAQSNVRTNNVTGTNAEFSRKEMRNLLSDIKRRKTKGKVTELIARPHVANGIAHMVQPAIMLDNTKMIEFFDNGVRLNKMKVLEAEGCTANTVYAMDYTAFMRGQIGPLIRMLKGPNGAGGTMMAVNGSGQRVSAWVTYFIHYGNLALARPASVGKLTDVAALDDTGFYDNDGGR